MTSHTLSLQSVVSIAGTLDSLLKKSFGPNAMNILLSTPTGKLMVTSAGMTILKSLNIAHPVGQMLIRSIESHHRITGDSTKTFLLLVLHIFSGLDKIGSNQATGSRMKFVKILNDFKNFLLPRKIWPSLKSECAVQMSHLSEEELRELLLKLSRTHFGGRLGRRTRDHFTDQLVNFVLTASGGCREKLVQTLQFVLENFAVLFHENPGSTQFETKTLPGFILTRHFMQRNARELGTQVRFVLLGCTLETRESDTKQEAIFSGLDKASLQRALLWNQRCVTRHVTALKENGVRLLLATTRVSELVLHLCSTHGIHVVQCVDEEEMEFLSRVSHVPVIHDPRDLLAENPSWFIGCAGSCVTVVISGRPCLQIAKPFIATTANGGTSELQAGENVSMIVCAPTPGMCSQFKSAVYNALKNLHMAFDPLCTLESFSCEAASSSRELEGHVVSGGGAFELRVRNALKDHVSVTRDSDEKVVLNVLCDALVSVPLALLQNSYASASSRMNLAQLLQLTTKLHRNGDSEPGVDAVGGTALFPRNSGVVQPLASKVLLLHHVVDFVIQVLRIDSVVGVSKIQPESDSSDED